MMFMLACSNFISAQSVEENCKMRSVILCDKSEKNILMYIVLFSFNKRKQYSDII